MSVFCVSDLHGQLELLHAVLDYIKPDDTLYVLGDSGDRGPQPWKTLKESLRDPRVIYIKGNHDDLLVRAYYEYIGLKEYPTNTYYDLMNNGGERTFLELLKEEHPEMWIQHINKQRTYAIETIQKGKFICLSHAGCNPKLEDGNIIIPAANDLMWNRTHFLRKVVIPDSVYVIHGHTPVQLLTHDIKELKEFGCKNICDDYKVSNSGIVWYNNHQKCCIDIGAVWTNQTVLLDLETFEEHIFKL